MAAPIDQFAAQQSLLDSPALTAFDAYAQKSDTVDLTVITRGIYTGSGGNIKVDMAGGGTMTFVSVPAGSLLPLRVRRLYSTGTAATDVIGLY